LLQLKHSRLLREYSVPDESLSASNINFRV
jgi:hypothetical protein